MRRIIASVILCLLTNAAAAEYVAQWNMRQQIYGAFYDALRKDEFSVLERAAELYRTRKSRMLDGSWQLYAFYNALEGVVPPKGQEQEIVTLRDKFKKWMEAYPSSPTPVLAYARFLLDLAWKTRGHGYSSEVWQYDMRRFSEIVSEARMLLENAEAYANRDPYWYSLLIAVLSSQGGAQKKIIEVAREGAAKEPDFFNVYSSVMHSLLPRWGGSAAAMEAWAQEATKLAGDDRAYASVYWSVEDYFDDDVLSEIDWNRFESGSDAILKRYPSPDSAEVAARLACKSRDAARVAKFANAAMELYGQSSAGFEAAAYCGWRTSDADDRTVISPDKLHRELRPKRTAN